MTVNCADFLLQTELLAQVMGGNAQKRHRQRHSRRTSAVNTNTAKAAKSAQKARIRVIYCVV
jgi:hypothetical protein